MASRPRTSRWFRGGRPSPRGGTVPRLLFAGLIVYPRLDYTFVLLATAVVLRSSCTVSLRSRYTLAYSIPRSCQSRQVIIFVFCVCVFTLSSCAELSSSGELMACGGPGSDCSQQGAVLWSPKIESSRLTDRTGADRSCRKKTRSLGHTPAGVFTVFGPGERAHDATTLKDSVRCRMLNLSSCVSIESSIAILCYTTPTFVTSRRA